MVFSHAKEQARYFEEIRGILGLFSSAHAQRALDRPRSERGETTVPIEDSEGRSKTEK
jgi:hypothetical protein